MWARGETRHCGPHTQITHRHTLTLTDKQVASLLHESGCGQRWKLAWFGLHPPPSPPSKTMLWGHLTGAAGVFPIIYWVRDRNTHRTAPPIQRLDTHVHTHTQPNVHIHGP